MCTPEKSTSARKIRRLYRPSREMQPQAQGGRLSTIGQGPAEKQGNREKRLGGTEKVRHLGRFWRLAFTGAQTLRPMRPVVAEARRPSPRTLRGPSVRSFPE